MSVLHSVYLSSHVTLLFLYLKLPAVSYLTRFELTLPLKVLSCGEVNYTDGLSFLFFRFSNFNPDHHACGKKAHKLLQICAHEGRIVKAIYEEYKDKAMLGLYLLQSCVLIACQRATLQ